MRELINKIIRFIQLHFSGKLTFKKFIPGIAWFFIVLFLICLPGKDLPKSNDWLNKIYFDKWVHTGMFGMLAMLFLLPVLASDLTIKKRKMYVIFIVFAVISWGLTTEFIQKAYIEGRTFDLFDWMADTIGTLIALFLSKYFYRKSERQHR